MLDIDIFAKITKLFFVPNIDLFASRLNKQKDGYISWKPDPDAFAVDAFTLSWTNLSFYAFPPFSILDRVCQNILKDKAEGILIAPYWNTQSWYPVLMKMCLKPPLLLTPSDKLLRLVNNPQVHHPLSKKLRLIVCHVSGNISNKRIFQKEQFQFL